MKKGRIIILILLITIIGIICFFVYGTLNDKVVYITDHEFLYDVAIDYLKEKYTEEEKEYNQKEDFNIFFDYKGFGISAEGDKKYAYMWILEESYYREDGEIKSGSGSSMPYKFTFENNKVIDYQIPEDGTYYAPSIKKMFPDDIENKILNYMVDTTKMDKEVKEYYSKNEVSLKIKENSLTKDGATFIMENNTDMDYYYGPEYSIEIRENGRWKTVEPKEDLSWNAVVFTLVSKEKQEININWSLGYETLKEGQYRLVKTITPKSNEEFGKTNIYAEFKI